MASACLRAGDTRTQAEPRKRDLQLAVAAHIDIQRWIDGGALKG
jgi:hypothetical protein